MKKIYFIGNVKVEFAKKDFDGRSDKGKKRDINQKYKDKFSSDGFKNTLKRNYAIAGVLGTTAGLGIGGGYALYKNKKLPQGNIVMPNVHKPLSHLKPPEEVFKGYTEKVYETGLTKDLLSIGKKREDEAFKNTGGWLLRPIRQNLKVKIAKRSINTDNVVMKPNIKSEADAEKFLGKYQQKYKNRQPTVKTRQGTKKFRFKAE